MTAPSSDTQAKLSALSGLALNFGKELRPELAKLWLRCLEDYSVDQVTAGVMHVIQTYEFKTLPPLAVLLRGIRTACGMAEPILLTKEQRHAAAAGRDWDRLMRLIEVNGSYRLPQMSGILAKVVRRMGGWSTVCAWPEGSLDFKRRDFVELWQEVGGNEAGQLESDSGADPVRSLPRGLVRSVDAILAAGNKAPCTSRVKCHESGRPSLQGANG